MTRKFTLEQINVNDEVFFEDKYQSNHDLYWKVAEKMSNGTLFIKLDEMGYHESCTINIKDVTHHLATSLFKK